MTFARIRVLSIINKLFVVSLFAGRSAAILFNYHQFALRGPASTVDYIGWLFALRGPEAVRNDFYHQFAVRGVLAGSCLFDRQWFLNNRFFGVLKNMSLP